ncbi:MAG: phospholipase domain-containing protein, partial [Chitinophagaceae bacterium]
GVPFTVYNMKDFSLRNYALVAGDKLTDEWNLSDHREDYHFLIYGPNGFFRELKGNHQDPSISVFCEYERKRLNDKKPTGNIMLQLKNIDVHQEHILKIIDNAYKNPVINKTLKPGETADILLSLNNSHGWYDFSILVKDKHHFIKRYAGHVETGEPSFTDPLMGRVIV